MSEEPTSTGEDPLAVARRGIDLCRDGEWRRGLELLGRLAESNRAVVLPGLFYSFLGRALAVEKGRTQEGLTLCEYAVKAQPRHPDNHLNLASVLLLLELRDRALGTLNLGLAIAPEHDGLLAARLELGVRRPPVVRFLPRHNSLNRILGRVRHRLRSA